MHCLCLLFCMVKTMVWREKEKFLIRRWMKGLTKVFSDDFTIFERMENDKNDETVYVEECVGSRIVGRPRKRWIDYVNDCLKKRF